MSTCSLHHANQCLSVRWRVPVSHKFLDGIVLRHLDTWVTCGTSQLWATEETLTFQVSQAKVGDLPKIGEGHDSIEDVSHCGHDVTFHFQTLPVQQHHTEVSEGQTGFPFFGLKIIIVSIVTIMTLPWASCSAKHLICIVSLNWQITLRCYDTIQQVKNKTYPWLVRGRAGLKASLSARLWGARKAGRQVSRMSLPCNEPSCPWAPTPKRTAREFTNESSMLGSVAQPDNCPPEHSKENLG